MRALFLSIGLGLHTSQRYSSGMLFLSSPIQTTCCQTLKINKQHERVGNIALNVSDAFLIKIHIKKLFYLFLVLNVCQVGGENVIKSYLWWSTTHFQLGNESISGIRPPPFH